MRVIFLSLMLAAAVTHAQQAAPSVTLTDAEKRFAEALVPIAARREEQLKAAATSYVATLKQIELNATNRGDLDLVLAAKTERERIEGGQEGETAKSLALYRKRYDELVARAHSLSAREEASLTKSYLAGLEDLQKRLTKEGQLDAAIEVKTRREALAAQGSNPAVAPTAVAPAGTVQVAAVLEANKGAEKLASDAVVFDGPRGDGRHGAKGILLKPAPTNAGSTWAFKLTWMSGSFETHIFHPVKDGQAIVHLGERTVALSTPKAWAEVGYPGPADSLRLTREFEDVFPLADKTDYEVVSRVNANSSYELFLNGVLVASGRASNPAPLDLEISMEKKFRGASSWAELKFAGIGNEVLPLKWSPGWAGVMAGPSDSGQYTRCADLVFYPFAADVVRKGP